MTHAHGILLALIPLAYVVAKAPFAWSRVALGAAISVNLLNHDLLGRDLFFRVLEYRHYGLAALLVAVSAASVDRLSQE